MNARLLLCLLLVAAPVAVGAEVAISGPGYTLTLSDQAVVTSLRTAAGRELGAAAARLPLATVQGEKGSANADSATLAGNLLTVGCSAAGTTLVYELVPAADWLVFRLREVRGTRPRSMMLLQLPVNLTAHVGPRLNAAYDDEQAVCLLAANHQPDCSAARRDYALLRAANQDAPGPKLEGAAVALIVCPTPRLKPVLREASHQFDLLTNEDAAGTPVKDTGLPRGSYWFLSAGEQDADRLIDYCNRAGLRQVMLNSGSWCRSVGHYVINESRFPRGEESLKAFIDKLHANGIKVGMHCFASKINKTDAYVTPVPDKRFWTDRRAVLPADISPEQTRIPGGDLSQWPGSPVCSQKYWEGGIDKHREVIIGDEIVRYETIGPEGKWDTFEGCQRGAWGTLAATHKGGAALRHYGVDGCINGYIVDQDTALFQETTDRLAAIFNNCGFDMIYFDGGEDVDRSRFNYYVSNFQETVMRKLKRRPLIHMGTIMTHLTWHSFARSATVDVYLATLYGAIQAGYKLDKWPSVRDHINKSVDYMLSVRNDLMPGELGWFGIWPKEANSDGLQLDEIEYLMCKSLAYEVPISLETSFGQMEQHPLTAGILDIVRAYEELRLAGGVDERTRLRLAEKDKDFALLREGEGRRFVAVTVVPEVAGGKELRATAGADGEGAVATLWHYVREAEVTIPLPQAKLRVLDFAGRPVATTAVDGGVRLTVGGARLTLLAAVPLAELVAALQAAHAEHKPAARLWIQAETGKTVGEMACGATQNLTEPGALGDFVVCTGRPATDQPREWYAEYTAQIPHPGLWTLWARVLYPGDGDMSFGLWLANKPLSLGSEDALGNCGLNEGKWHWTGRGGGSTTPPPGSPIRLTLPQGPFTFRVVAREGRGTAATNPRLDLLCLTDDATEQITDALAAEALKSPRK